MNLDGSKKNTPLARFLDAAILKPDCPVGEAREAILSCLSFQTKTVCVRPSDLGLAVSLCRGSQTGACVVLAFPHGQQLSRSKVDEANHYLEAGAAEIDMVANIGWIRSGLWSDVTADIAGVCQLTRPAGVPLKVILETAYLNTLQIEKATLSAIEAGADFVKTSTGFASGGATVDAVDTMLRVAEGRIKVKASGGIRTREEAEAFLRMGVERLGVGYTTCPALCGDTGDQPEGTESAEFSY